MRCFATWRHLPTCAKALRIRRSAARSAPRIDADFTVRLTRAADPPGPSRDCSPLAPRGAPDPTDAPPKPWDLLNFHDQTIELARIFSIAHSGPSQASTHNPSSLTILQASSSEVFARLIRMSISSVVITSGGAMIIRSPTARMIRSLAKHRSRVR